MRTAADACQFNSIEQLYSGTLHLYKKVNYTMTNNYLYKAFFANGDTVVMYTVSPLMILCIIALPNLAIHVIKLYTFFLINILHVGKSLDTNNKHLTRTTTNL